MKESILKILKAEVKPAMGCTEPVAVVLASAKARSLMDHEGIQNIKVSVSPNFYKNGLSVGIPHTDMVGLDVAAALGAVGGDSELGLKIMASFDDAASDEAKKLLDKKLVSVDIEDTDEKVYIEVEIVSQTGTSKAVICKKHNLFTELIVDGKSIDTGNGDTCTADSAGKNSKADKAQEEAINPIFTATIAELVKTIETMRYDELAFLLEGIEMNDDISKEGLKRKMGMGVGYTIKKQVEDGLLANDLTNMARYMTAAASDARMAGVSKPVMSSNGSGNNGITAIIPIVAYSKLNDVTDEQLVKALAISHTLNCYIKNFIGRLSALCSCGVSAATGSGAAITWLMGGTMEQIEGTIQNMIANVSGMICDGAKNGCALKLATAASTGVHSAYLSLYGTTVAARDGIIGETAEESIRNLGIISDKGMRLTDLVILDVMKDMDERKVH